MAENPPRLLVVDDVEDNRVILVRRFGRLGYEVAEAENGENALALIEAEPFDVVLLDIMMPGIDGIEVLRRVRKTRTQNQLPIVMVSAKATSEDVVEALLLGANDYVTKPVDLKVAQARVEAQIARKRQEDVAAAARGDLEEALAQLRAAVATARPAATGDGPSELGRALDVADVVARVCQSPDLQDTISAIDGAVGALKRLATPTAAREPEPGPAARRIRILSADGAAADRQVVRQMLAEAETGVELLEVCDGAEAVAAATAQPFDLIVMGLQMPGMDGLAAIRAIREHELKAGPRTPILAVSAHQDSGALALKAGADLHLTKPVTAAAMLNAVVRALSQGSEKLGGAVA